MFNQIDRALKMWQRRGPREVQRAALRAAEKWMLDHTRYSRVAPGFRSEPAEGGEGRRSGRSGRPWRPLAPT